MQSIYWLVAAAVLIVLEILTMGLTTIWFAGGALVAALAALVRLPLFVQVIIFLVISFALLLITRPLATRYLNDRTVRTNAEGLVGMTCLVTKEIDNLHSTGEVNIRGQMWSARSVKNGMIIPENSIVRVEEIHGVKLMVSVVSTPEQVAVRREE